MSEDEQEGLYRVYKDDIGWVYEKFAEIDELRELVEDWRDHGMDGKNAQIFEMCAEDLEELINDE